MAISSITRRTLIWYYRYNHKLIQCAFLDVPRAYRISLFRADLRVLGYLGREENSCIYSVTNNEIFK